MSDLVRQQVTQFEGVLVVKVGTRVLSTPDGKLDQQRIACLAQDLARQREAGRRVVLVSSGAVGAGLGRLGLDRRPQDLSLLQAVAAVGQAHLIETYERTLQVHGLHAAQVLLTADDLQHRGRYLNVRNTLSRLLEMELVPIINENDTVAVDELATTFGDNDRLAALVASLLRAPLLLMLSDVEGLMDRHPADPGARLLPTVRQVDKQLTALVRDQASGPGKGGMASKLEAARIVTSAGENAIIANGHRDGVIGQVMAGEPVGTLFLAKGKPVSPFKRWIGFSARPQGTLKIDDGACAALRRDGKSLLAIGIVESSGTYLKGDVVSICDPRGGELARGLTNYSSDQVERIVGLRSDRIAQVLGQRPYEEVIHRDNLALQ